MAARQLLLGDEQGSAQVMMPLYVDAVTGELLEATLTDAASTQRTAYMPYVMHRDGGLSINRGWLGQTSDTSGLTYLNARYYDPHLARFLSPDPLMDPGDPRTLDPYRYADNNPVLYTDPSGLAPNFDNFCVLGFIGINCPTLGQSISDNPMEAGFIDGAADTVVGFGEAFTPEGIEENWNSYTSSVEERGIFAGTGHTLVGAPSDAFEDQLKATVGCASSILCMASPTGQYNMGYGSGQLGVEVAAVGLTGAGSLSIKAISPKPVVGSFAPHGRPNFLRSVSAKAEVRTGGNPSSSTVVVGRNMDMRVIPYANAHGYGYYTGTPNWIPRTVPGTNQPIPARTIIDLAYNKAWIKTQMNAHRTIVDIGPGKATNPSPFYAMEQRVIRSNPNYTNNKGLR